MVLLRLSSLRCVAVTSKQRNSVIIVNFSGAILSTTCSIDANNSEHQSVKGTRINKCFPSLSRRAVDDFISRNRILVNGTAAAVGQRLRPTDTLTLDGTIINWTAHIDRPSEDNIYIKCWKPPGVVCTADMADDNNIISFFDFDRLPKRVFTIGRLDKESSGLILLTSDGPLMNKLLGRHHASIQKTYVVTTIEPVSHLQLEQLREGVDIELPFNEYNAKKRQEFYIYKTLPCAAKIVDRMSNAVELSLVEGKNRQLRRMFPTVGLTVKQIHRIQFANIDLSALKEGQWRLLSDRELKILRQLAAL